MTGVKRGGGKKCVPSSQLQASPVVLGQVWGRGEDEGGEEEEEEEPRPGPAITPQTVKWDLQQNEAWSAKSNF